MLTSGVFFKYSLSSNFSLVVIFVLTTILLYQKSRVLFCGGYSIELEKYTVLKDTTPLAIAGVTALPHNAVICGGRPIMIMLGVPSGKSASVYKVVISDDKIIEITEVLITGVIDPALQ